MTDTVNVPRDVRLWEFFPIVMPITKCGEGPASVGEIETLTWEVWDRCHQSHASYDNLPDAINDCISRNALAAALKAEPVAYVSRKGFTTGGLVWTKEGMDANLPDETKLYTHPAPSSDEMLEAWSRLKRSLTDSLLTALAGRIEDVDRAIAKHKGPQS